MMEDLIRIAGILLTIAIGVGYGYGLYKLKKKEEEVFNLQDKVDNIEQDEESKRMLHSGAIPQHIFEARNEKRRKPMEAQLNRLKMERQFLLDKIPLIGWFRK